MKHRLAPSSSVMIQHETIPTSLTVKHDMSPCPETYPCLVRVQQHQEGRVLKEETIRAKYVIGADGAGSWTRKQLQLTSQTTKTGALWGVIDVRVTSDFPEYESPPRIHSSRVVLGNT